MRCPRYLVANVLNCNIRVSEFELQLCFSGYIRTITFEESMYPNSQAMGEIIQLHFSYKGGFGIKKVDKPLNKEIEIKKLINIECNREIRDFPFKKLICWFHQIPGKYSAKKTPQKHLTIAKW